MMLEFLRQMIQIEVNPNCVIFTGKWLLVCPVAFVNVWVYWRAVKSFFRKRK